MTLTNQEQAELDERVAFHTENFKPLSPIENIIIRGHLQIEQELTRSIELAVPNKEALQGHRFTFANKIVIADMLSMLGPYKKVIQDINTLRNEIAHPSKKEDKKAKLTDSIINEIAKINSTSIETDKDKVLPFAKAISYICGFIAASHRFATVAYIPKVSAMLKEKTPDTSK